MYTMGKDIFDLISPNKRVGSSAGQYSLFESYDSNGWSVCSVGIVPIPPHTPNIMAKCSRKNCKFLTKRKQNNC